MTTIIGEQYQLGDQLGRGGMGTVYLGVDTQMELDVAIKRLHPDMANEEQIARFQREGAALRELDHPNIVKMLDAFQDGADYYLVMEYIQGGDLNQLIETGSLTHEQIIRMAIDLADALTRAHKLGIIHRDLKPANVLIAEDGTLRLTDFGMAHVRHQATISDVDVIVGTVNYLSPEALAGEEVNESMDIWAFGVLFYEMLTGETPYHRESLTLTIAAIMHDPIPDIAELVPDLSPEIEDLVYRMLERDPQARISSVRYVGAILEDIQQGRTTGNRITTRFASSIQLHSAGHHNLPEQITEFVGREAEISEVQRLLDAPSTRLITILAPGGMGKTRLALEVARQNLASYNDGVFFIELAALDHADKIVAAIASAIGVQLIGSDPKQKLLQELSDKQYLLVIDNWEHILDGAPIVTDILKAAPDITIIATSRIRLGQMGETLFHLAGMNFPKWETPEDALNYAAVKLFMNSAKRARPNFELLTDDLDYVARICRLVQGMPLGILLAAAWVAMLSPKDIADELQQGMDLLVDEAGELPERQQSIEVVMDYAWQSMMEAEQAVFAKLTLFRGGFSRDAAQKVTQATLRTLMSLVNKSFIRRDNDSGRYEIHELLRQFGETHLQLSPEYTATRTAHLDYYAAFLMDRYQPLRSGDRQFVVEAELRQEIENIQRAWFYALDQADIDRLRAMLECLHHYYFDFGSKFDGATFFERTLANFSAEQTPDMIHFEQMVRIHYAELLLQTGHIPQAESMTIEGLAYAEQHPDDTYMLHYALRTRGRLYGVMGDMLASYKLMQERILPLVKRIPDKIYYLDSLVGKAFILSVLGVQHQEEMKATLQEALTVAEEVGNNNARGLIISNLDAVEAAMGNWDETEKRINTTLQILKQESMYTPVGYSSLVYKQARMSYIKAKFDEAINLAQDSLAICLENQYYQTASRCVSISGWVARANGNYAEAIEHGQQSMSYAKKAGSYHDIRVVEFYLVLNQYSLSPTVFDRNALIETLLKNASDYQLMVRFDVVLAFATLKHQDGDETRAVELLASVLEHPKCPPVYLADFAPIEMLREVLQETLSDADYQSAWEQGAAGDFEAYVAQLKAEYSD